MKCFKCIMVVDHTFKDCTSEKCSCQCVQQLFQKKPNTQLEEMDASQPDFLRISDDNIVTLPNLNTKILDKLTKIDKNEWVTKKLDKRTSRYRNKKKRKA